METKKLTIKNETEILRDTIYGMMKEIQEKLEQGYSIKSVYRTYEKDEKFPYYVQLEFKKEDDE
jgi:hypothetical protein|uniref:Uncharacterized protein n=1 Tax=Myoviridae sp. ctkfK18 TaxID=2825165 RepID=A0A8S5VH09_9CAUD|nr:MAG TPA: hypothetical protein [Myoviridae sp. ctkfK18]